VISVSVLRLGSVNQPKNRSNHTNIPMSAPTKALTFQNDVIAEMVAGGWKAR
jgi:hypothetical protein